MTKPVRVHLKDCNGDPYCGRTLGPQARLVGTSLMGIALAMQDDKAIDICADCMKAYKMGQKTSARG